MEYNSFVNNSTFEIYGNSDEKIIRGDALEILKTIPDESIDLIFVDPPYNIGKNFAGRKDKWKTDDLYGSYMFPPNYLFFLL